MATALQASVPKIEELDMYLSGTRNDHKIHTINENEKVVYRLSQLQKYQS